MNHPRTGIYKLHFFCCVKQLLFFLCLPLALRGQTTSEQQWQTLSSYWENKQFEEARIEANKLVALPEEERYLPLKGKAHRVLAKIHASHSHKPEEIEHLFKSYGYFKRAKDPHEEARALQMIGSYYLHLKQLQKAAEYLTLAKEQSRGLYDTLLRVDLLSNLGQLDFAHNRFKTSISFFEEAIVLAQKIKYEPGLLMNWDRLSFTYWRKGDTIKMLTCLKEALRHITQQTPSDTVAILYSDLGLGFLENNRLDSAEWSLQKSLNILRKGGNRVQELILYQHFSALRLKQGRRDEAMEFLQRYSALQENIFNSQLLEEASYADVRFKENEAHRKLLEAENRDRLLLAGLISVVVLLLALIFIIYWLRRNNRIIRKHEIDLQTALVKLGQNEKLYRQLFENSLALIITHTMDGRIINANRATEQTLKRTKEKLQGTSIRDYLQPKYKNLFDDYLHEIKTKCESEGWMRVMDGDGVYRILRYQNRVVESMEGHVVVGFAQDQTEIFHTRAELEREHKRMMTVMENSPDIFSVLNENATITYMNRPVFPDMSETAGQNMLHYRGSEQAARFYRKLIKVFDTNKPVELQESFNGKHYLTKLVPITLDNRVKEVLSINTDITSQKQAEIELSRAKEEAEESNRLKTIFLGSLSHEVRTPLQGIMGMAELLELPTTSEEKRKEFIQIIKRRTNDMQNIIESLLDMASLETGEIKSFPVETNLHESLETVYQNTLQDDLLASKPIKLALDLSISKQATVFVDPQHLQQVFTNLLRNSIKFTNEGTITLSCHLCEANYLVKVKDTGIGIAPEKIDQIFKPFRQAHEGLSRSKGGIGLGLSICKKMVEMWEGDILVESQPGKGSVFTVVVPT